MAQELDTAEEAGAQDNDFVAFDPPVDRIYKAHMVGGGFEKLAEDDPYNPGKVRANIRFRLDHDEALGEDLMKMCGGQLVRLREVTSSDRYLRFLRMFEFDPKTFRPKDYPEMACRLRLKKRSGERKVANPDDPQGEPLKESGIFVDVDGVFRASAADADPNWAPQEQAAE
jgi:hypothetical protein